MVFTIGGIVAVLFLIADQITKAYIAANYSPSDFVGNFIPGVIDFNYINNSGGAWGLMEGYTWALLAITMLLIIICISMLIKNGFKSKLLFWAVCLILSGGIGNMIDRIFRGGKVVDFIQFAFWKEFPIFNIADCAVCIGALLLFLYFIADIINDRKKQKNINVQISEIKSSEQDN